MLLDSGQGETSVASETPTPSNPTRRGSVPICVATPSPTNMGQPIRASPQLTLDKAGRIVSMRRSYNGTQQRSGSIASTCVVDATSAVVGDATVEEVAAGAASAMAACACADVCPQPQCAASAFAMRGFECATPFAAAGNGAVHDDDHDDDDDDDEEGLCDVCFDHTACVDIRDCGHQLCVDCCRELCNLHHFKPALCPFCRRIIHSFQMVEV